MVAEGRSYRWIARELGINKNTVGAIVNRDRDCKPTYVGHEATPTD